MDKFDEFTAQFITQRRCVRCGEPKLSIIPAQTACCARGEFTRYVLCNGKEIPYGSEEHYALFVAWSLGVEVTGKIDFSEAAENYARFRRRAGI